MPNPATLALALLFVAPLAEPAAFAEPRGQASAAMAAAQPSGLTPAAVGYPIGVQLMTLVDHAATLSGFVVQVPPVTVRRVVAPGLVIVATPHGRGNYHSYGPSRWDRLLVLLPESATLARGDQVVLAGTLRTLRGVQRAGRLPAVKDDVLKHFRDAPLLVADTVDTPDGVSLSRR